MIQLKKKFKYINKQLKNYAVKLEKTYGAVLGTTIIQFSYRPRIVIENIPEDRKDDKFKNH